MTTKRALSFGAPAAHLEAIAAGVFEKYSIVSRAIFCAQLGPFDISRTCILKNRSKSVHAFLRIAPERDAGAVWPVVAVFRKIDTLRLWMIADRVVADTILLLDARGKAERW